MKTLLIILALITPAIAAEKRVKLPADSQKLYVSLYVENNTQFRNLIETYPQIAQYRQGNHFNVYKKGQPFTETRFKNVVPPVAYVQKADGSIIWTSTEAWCPFKFWKKRRTPDKVPDEVPVDDEYVDEDEIDIEIPAPVDPGPAPFLLLAIAALGLAAGAGSKFVEELKEQ